MRTIRIVLGAHKGGVGKTTLAISLAGALRELEPKTTQILVIDGDTANRSATVWSRPGRLPFKVAPVATAATVIPGMLSPDLTHFIMLFDLRGGEGLQDFGDADLVIVPTLTDTLSMQGCLQTVAELGKLGLADRYRIVLNAVPPPPQADGREAKAFLLDRGYRLFDMSVPRLKAATMAADDGVWPGDHKQGQRLADTFRELAREVITLVKE